MLKPVDHPILGRLTYESTLERWSARVTLDSGCLVDFSMGAWTVGTPQLEQDELFSRGVDFLKWAREVESKCLQRIADDLLDCYNDDWRSENAPPITRKEFIQRITPKSIVVNTDGSGFFYFSDGGMFGHHLIELRVDNRRFHEAALAG